MQCLYVAIVGFSLVSPDKVLFNKVFVVACL